MRRIRLDIDALDAGVVQEVIHIGAAHGAGKHAVDVRVVQAQRGGLAVVNIQAQLGGVIQVGGTHCCQLGMFARLLRHKIAGGQQGFVAHAVHVLQHEVEARIGTQTTHGGRIHHKDLGVADAAQFLGCLVRNGQRRLRRQRALRPGLETHKAACRALVTIEAGDLVEANHIRLLDQIVTHLVQHFLQTRI